MRITPFIIFVLAIALNVEGQSSIFNSSKNNILPANEAFNVSYKIDNNFLEVTWNIKDNYYLYLNSIKIENNDQDISFKTLVSDIYDHNDQFFGDRKIIRGLFKISSEEMNKNHSLLVKYQGCSDIGFCYPVQILKVY
ncbi:MAG: thiol:disulfide interchange protein [Gammaproteobacteria bacterium]|nr:thiol:disulfide interchange protein [Gammaproteobacteria bacterium]|tara:strand:- start:1423 stop:1836 length:414 start_codon:yes stop_codon:yes gene_type:complete